MLGRVIFFPMDHPRFQALPWYSHLRLFDELITNLELDPRAGAEFAHLLAFKARFFHLLLSPDSLLTDSCKHPSVIEKNINAEHLFLISFIVCEIRW